MCFKALTFIVINLELLPYNSSTLSPKKYHRQDGVLQTPKTIHFMVLWRPRSLLSSVPLYGQITARKIYIDIASIFHCLGIGLFIKNALSLLKNRIFPCVPKPHETIYCRWLRATRISSSYSRQCWHNPWSSNVWDFPLPSSSKPIKKLDFNFHAPKIKFHLFLQGINAGIIPLISCGGLRGLSSLHQLFQRFGKRRKWRWCSFRRGGGFLP